MYIYHPQAKLRGFTPVCHAVQSGGVSVPACITGDMTGGWGLCPGGLCPGVSLCLGSLSRGVSVWGDLCLGSLSRGVSVWGDLCLGFSVWGGLCLGCLCVREPLNSNGRYASYWNAFLFYVYYKMEQMPIKVLFA